MVDYYVDAENVVGTNYYVTKLTCDNYNPSIDSDVSVTLTLLDVYERPVVGEVVTVTASAGNFTALNGESITAGATVEGTTDASGQFTLTYSCISWGIITFTANNTLNQINVQGWREVTLPSTVASYCNLYVNEALRICEFKYYRTNYNFTNTSSITLHNGLIPQDYRPLVNIICASFNQVIVAGVITDGSLSVASSTTGSKNINIYAMWTY